MACLSAIVMDTGIKVKIGHNSVLRGLQLSIIFRCEMA